MKRGSASQPMAIDQGKLDKEFIYSGRGPAAELLAGLDQIAPLEAKLKSRPRLVRWVALAVFVAFVALCFLLDTAAFVAPAIIVPIGLLIWSLFLRAALIVHDRIELLRLALNTLNQDSGKKTRFDVRLRLRAGKEKISEGPNPHKAGGKQILYKDPWLTLGCRLGDGTTVSESYLDLIRERTRRNPRGKTKTKERRIVTIRMQLNYDPAVYGDASIAALRLANPFRLPSGVQCKNVNTTATDISVKAIVNGNISPQTLNAAHEAIVLGAYRILNLARRRIAVQRGAK